MNANNPASLSVQNVKVVSPLPRVNYVARYPIHVPTTEDEPFIVYLTSFDLDLVGDMVNHLLGTFKSDLFIGSLDMYPFQCIVLPSNRNLLEAMASCMS